jgi:hypothetical protein
MLNCDTLRTALFWVITQTVVVFLTNISGQPIGPNFSGQESKRKPVVPIQNLYREECVVEIGLMQMVGRERSMVISVALKKDVL